MCETISFKLELRPLTPHSINTYTYKVIISVHLPTTFSVLSINLQRKSKKEKEIVTSRRKVRAVNEPSFVE